MIKIAVADDEKECLDQIGGYLDRIDGTHEFERFLTTDAERLFERQEDGRFFDIVFLDIEMEGMTGIEAAKRIVKEYPGTLILFTTAYRQYVREAFYVNAFQYLFKPIEYRDFCYELERAVAALRSRDRAFEIHHGAEKILLKCSDILSVETRGRHLAVRTADREYEYSGTIRDAEERLDGCGFSKIEQGILINMSHVRRVESECVELDSGDRKYISRRMYKPFLSKLNRYLAGG